MNRVRARSPGAALYCEGGGAVWTGGGIIAGGGCRVASSGETQRMLVITRTKTATKRRPNIKGRTAMMQAAPFLWLICRSIVPQMDHFGAIQ